MVPLTARFTPPTMCTSSDHSWIHKTHLKARTETPKTHIKHVILTILPPCLPRLRPRVRAAAVHVGLIAARLELRALSIVGHLAVRGGGIRAGVGMRVRNRRRELGNLGLGAEI